MVTVMVPYLAGQKGVPALTGQPDLQLPSGASIHHRAAAGGTCLITYSPIAIFRRCAVHPGHRLSDLAGDGARVYCPAGPGYCLHRFKRRARN